MKKEELKKELNRALEWSSKKQDKLFKSNWLTKKIFNHVLKISSKF